eukprot:CAMPEP_0185774406 /NCGR_PEP_ID=MMETSP1174-20130828/77994_1 /TAXON_ID=35687 /ORGANISM="Dictyocha speculum, Strain CCMP1381" /LENGTH=162 /DNA_ID=CAMNT_0028461545 /DNA_START=98 /DNA_END=583 /DNA_ORIENTATION=+
MDDSKASELHKLWQENVNSLRVDESAPPAPRQSKPKFNKYGPGGNSQSNNNSRRSDACVFEAMVLPDGKDCYDMSGTPSDSGDEVACVITASVSRDKVMQPGTRDMDQRFKNLSHSMRGVHYASGADDMSLSDDIGFGGIYPPNRLDSRSFKIPFGFSPTDL